MSRNWTPVASNRTYRTDPCISVYRNLNGYLNRLADEMWFAEYDHVVVLIDEADNYLGFKPVDANRPDAYQLSRGEDGELGADVTVKPALKKLGLEEECFPETQKLDLEETDDGIVAVDVTPLLEEAGLEGADESDDIAEEGIEDDGVEGFECDECEKTFSTETGRNIHYGQIHDDNTNELSEGIDEEMGIEESDPDDEDDVPDVEALVANGVGSVHELGEELGVTSDHARKIAMDQDVYSELTDTPDEEGGYGRVSGDV